MVDLHCAPGGAENPDLPSLIGVSLLYAQTGALNMAQAGASLAQHNPGNAFVLALAAHSH